jgi:uncharacterized protein YecE (DUF72 family)
MPAHWSHCGRRAVSGSRRSSFPATSTRRESRPAATADVAPIRFHGRNSTTWGQRGISPQRRYAYDYTAEELAEWVPKIRTLHAGSRPVHVLMNNCWQGFAVRSSHTLAGLLAEDGG